MNGSTNKKNKTVRSRGNTAVIVTAIICALLVAVLLYMFFFADMIAAKSLLSDVRKGIDGCTEVLVADPLYDGGVLPDAAETLVTGDEAMALAQELISITHKASYKSVLKTTSGFWDISLCFFVGDDEYTVYLREDKVYVADGKGYLFDIDEKNSEAYAEFYQKINNMLDKSK